MIVPDTKDWTWVLDRPCADCGYAAADLDVREVPQRVRANAASWQAVLARPDARSRPQDGVWSPLEYGCHVRDVLRLYDDRLRMMLEQDDPLYPNWDQDATALEQRYHEQDPAFVATELQAAADTVAGRFAALTGEQWGRPGRRSDGAAFTVDSFARYFLHDVVHHLHDVQG